MIYYKNGAESPFIIKIFLEIIL